MSTATLAHLYEQQGHHAEAAAIYREIGDPRAEYWDFLRAKTPPRVSAGFEVEDSEIHPLLLPHQRDCVRWAVRGGRRALFEAFGLGKTMQQLEILRLVLAKSGGRRALIIAPLGVRQEFRRDAERLGIELLFVRRSEEVDGSGLYITNYESVRDGRLDVNLFAAASLDEASCLRGFGGTKTFREFMRLFEGNEQLRYRFVATATPSPNEYIELIAYAAFLEIMDVGQAKTRFFRRNAEKADELTIHPHKEAEFWAWVSTWAVFLQRPSDLGYSDAGYDLPPIEVRWHEIPTDHRDAGEEKSGQRRLLRRAAVGLAPAAAEKRSSLDRRVEKLLEIRAEEPGEHRLIWHDLEDERRAIERAIPGVVSVYGAQDLEERERRILEFSDGLIPELAAKPVLAGSGCNFQRHCARAVFLGIGFKFNDFIQAIHRLQRFQQARAVRIDLIYTENERQIRAVLEAKWERHREMVQRMSEIIRRHRLAESAMAAELTRSLGTERIEVKGDGYRLVCNDAVLEMPSVATDSVGLIVTSVPFSTQYEYTPSLHDFGHTDDNGHFWRQMDFLTPHLLRVLMPGRVAAVHVKDRITPGGISGLGFQTVSPFHCEAIVHYLSHGFAFLGMKTIVTDVVRENNQTYRLGWTEQCKDGSRMGAGLPEYVLLFRKPPTDRSNGYADQPVEKPKKVWRETEWENPTGYSRARWQLDAHAFARSSGNRLLKPEELAGIPAEQVYKTFRRFSLEGVYDFEHHVRIGEHLEALGSLPPTFMLLPPQSWHPEVWTDVTRMLTLNGQQYAKGKEMHLCPLQFDIIDRLVRQFSQEAEVVFDPFGGLMSVPYRAVKLGRQGLGIELSPSYFLDGVAYVEAAARDRAMPGLFDWIEEPPGAPAAVEVTAC